MKTRILGVLFAMILVIAAFVSCGPTEETPGGNTNKPGGNTAVEIPEGAPSYNYNWETTTIKLEYTNNSASNELSSGCARYYAGTAANQLEDIDNYVRSRNRAAAKQANVEVDYSYVGEDGAYGWGANIVRICRDAILSNSELPDIYINFAYDLTCAQLRGVFANLKDTETHASGNYFRFVEDDYNPSSDNYFDAAAGEGYFYDYMQSVSLSDDKMYVLASNYCTDLVRAFLVVPVNIQMLNGIQAADSWTGDMKDYNDFYDLVWREGVGHTEAEKYEDGWTYEVLAHYASKVWRDANRNDNDKLGDDLGFIAGTTSGLVSSGFLYTSSVKIIDKQPILDDAGNPTGSYTFTYPESNENLDNYAQAITQLFTNSKGVVTAKSSEAKLYSSTADNELIMIREKFASNEVLFGGVIAVGSLEDQIYQKMRVDGEGFGILPVPVYDKNQDYLTLVHNIARVVTIAKGSTEFSQCSAFLDYVSRMSDEIMETYYTDILGGKAGGTASAQNSRMLTYIRNHVRDCFDKTFEDAVAYSYANEVGSDAATASKWHEILGSKNEFKVPSFKADYDAQRPKKIANLNTVVDAWYGR